MKITMLGTGNAMVTECYNTCYVIEDEGQLFLVDGGGGNTIIGQLKKAGIDYRNIHDVFVTHKHVDHIMGIIWMMRLFLQNMKAGKYEGDVRIYGHSEVIALLHTLAESLLQKAQYSLIGERMFLIPVENGETAEIIGRKMTFFDIESTKAKQYGYRMELSDGQILTCCGDEPYHPCEEMYARNADWLLHEAFCLYTEADRFHPYEKDHSTVKDACMLAEELGVKNLLLYHTEDQNIRERKKLYLAEGRKFYHGNLYVPDDLETIELPLHR